MYQSPFVVCMYVYILVYQSPHNPSFILSFSRMAIVWVKFEDGLPDKITVEDGVDVYDLIKSYLHEEMVGIPARSVFATYKGEELRRGRPVSEIVTSDVDPIVLRKVIEVEEGMYSRTQKNFHYRSVLMC